MVDCQKGMKTISLTRVVFILFVLTALLGESVLVLSKQSLNTEEQVEPSKGVFLVASPGLGDPRFRRTVVLLLDHGLTGTMGIIINRATDIRLSDVLPGLSGSNKNPNILFFGGPVQLTGIIFLTRSDNPPEDTSHIMEDVYFGGDKGVLEYFLKEESNSDKLRLYMGYSGWAPGQLASEIEGGSWFLVRGDAHTVFEMNPDRVWSNLIKPPMLSPIATFKRRQKLDFMCSLNASDFSIRQEVLSMYFF